MKLLIAIKENKGEESALSEHFGHCPYFAIYDSEIKKLTIEKNDIDHSIEDISPVDQIMKFNPDKLFTLGVGQRAINLFNKKGIEILTGNFKKLKEVIENISNLQKLTSGCDH